MAGALALFSMSAKAPVPNQEESTHLGSSATPSLYVLSHTAWLSPHVNGVASGCRKMCTVFSAPIRQLSASHSCQTRLVVHPVSSVPFFFHVGCDTVQSDVSSRVVHSANILSALLLAITTIAALESIFTDA
jgi:hypothetical protein